MNAEKVSVVILNYNTRDLLDKFLPEIMATDYPNMEVVVADNASSDDSVSLVAEKYPTVKLIRLEENYGFAGGYNKALAQLDTEYWVLLNSDVNVDKNWLTPMMDLMKSDSTIAAVQPKILDFYNPEKFEYAGASGGFIDKYAYPLCRGRVSDVLETDNGQYDSSRPIFWATGAALLVRAADYKSLNGLDADFFAHMEEIDLCWRLQNSGKQIWVCPEAKVYHMGGGTLSAQNPRKTFLNFRNNLVLITKNLPFGEWLKVLTIRLILDGVAGVKLIVDGKARHTLAIIQAHWAYFFRFGFWWKKRRESPKQKPFKEHDGMLNLSVVYRHYIKGVKYFSDLEK